MKRKINLELAITSLVAILFTVMLSTVIYYDMFHKDVTNSLKTYTHIIKNLGPFEQETVEREIADVDGLRVTLIDSDGTVIYESNADIGDMDNHADRPEIHVAFETGEGEAMRRSDTVDKNAFYYAVRLENGKVLRVAREADSIFRFWYSLLPLITVIVALLLLICLAIAHFLTKSIMSPIENMANHLDDENQKAPYHELQPFLDTIQQQHKELVKSTQMRQEFTANVSHELKTPLTTISGYSELIESGITSREDDIRFAKEIHKSSNRLLTLINDILRLSELDISEQNPAKEPVNLYELAEKCVDMLQISAEKYDVSLMLSGRPCMVFANREMMEELLYNLCSNAIRYNVPKGRVVVDVSKDVDHTVLTVEDTGIGIPKEEQERIFERFYRVDKSRSKSTGGTGLGLAIVKHVVAKHDAQIELQSAVGEGTRIRVTF